MLHAGDADSLAAPFQGAPLQFLPTPLSQNPVSELLALQDARNPWNVRPESNARRTKPAAGGLARSMVVEPNPDLAYAMPIVAPDPAVDFKLQVIEPGPAADQAK